MHISNLAIVTVSNERFLQGTMVLFQSLLNNNGWFRGDLIVIDAGLSESSKQKLIERYNVIFLQPSGDLDAHLDKLIASFPIYQKTRARFYSLEAFSLIQYDQVLYLDSDILCTGDCSGIINPNYAFAACADVIFYIGCKRDKKTWLPIDVEQISSKNGRDYIDRLFNTGVMVMNKELLQTGVYEKLIKAIEFKSFEHIKTGHTDTVVLNNELLDRVVWLGKEYNFYASRDQDVIEAKIVPVFVHFLGKNKPWDIATMANKWTLQWNDVKKTWMQYKVFCIGFHKTATSSLGKAMEMMGYRNCHGAGAARRYLGEKEMMENLFRKNYAPFFDLANEFDSFNDNPWFKIYKELDMQFPGSKFILMLRDEQQWLNSCKKYFGHSSSAFRLWLYGKGSPIGNEEKYLRVYRQHNKDVLEYFADRPDDLLIINLEDENIEEQLNQFLTPLQLLTQFPHLNKS